MKQINDVRVFFKKSTYSYHITQRYTCSVLLIYDIIYDMICRIILIKIYFQKNKYTLICMILRIMHKIFIIIMYCCWVRRIIFIKLFNPSSFLYRHLKIHDILDLIKQIYERHQVTMKIIC